PEDIYGPAPEPGSKLGIPSIRDVPFFAGQELRILRNRGLIDPEEIEDYIARDGYSGMARALGTMTPEQIVEEVLASGLRGRGGAGFPTGLKWRFAAGSKADVKYVLCNADEGDPGAYMDRSLLEGDPHSVLEGMVIAAKAIGAHQGYIYCRAEYPLAIKTLTSAIEQARGYGLLGENILGTGFDFDLSIYQGAGAFVCGEETALMTSIEGKRGEPRSRPPFPAVSGLWGKPSVLNNVETLASIGQIIEKGAAWFSSVGREKSKGTKIFALTGDVCNVGLVEVPMGIPLGTVVFDIGGGIPGGKKFKAAQLGGPSGGCIPAEHLNAAVDYETVAKLGAIMGSGGMIVMDEDKCAVDMARFFMDFCQDESCGKCTPCREGTKRMLEILENICQGRGRNGDIELLEEMAENIKRSALCGLGQTAPNPVLSTIRYFRSEYEAHINEKRCPAVVCSALFKSPCRHACPAGMDIPSYIALVRAERLEDAYKVLLRSNPFPAVCGRVCDHKCQFKCRRGTADGAVSIKNLKRFITDNAVRPAVSTAAVTRVEKIAVIGAGPAGLTAARDLAMRGYEVVVFESRPEAGGWMRWGIPEYRLPRDILGAEISDMAKLGVEIRTGTEVGRDISFKEIDDGFDYVFLAIGARRSSKMNIPGEDMDGVHGGVEFLSDFNADPDSWLEGRKMLGGRVAVIGGGNTAIDAARTAVRLGAEVTIFYRRERRDMPAQEAEITAAEQEGVRVEYMAAPVEIVGDDHRVRAVKLRKMMPGDFDASGRRRPIPGEGGVSTVDVDAVVVAVGQAADTAFLGDDTGVKINKRSYLETTGGWTTATGNARYFAGGDAVTGPATVIEAIAAGQRAACEIDEAVRNANGEPPYQAPPEEEILIPLVIEEEDQDRAPAAMPELDAENRRRSFAEVELGYDAGTAIREATRCLRCDAEL
ncbi:MAG TPA: NADH-quinone oxidoreductase subunit NuoF, partial [Desulfobacteraceae bacterium]|nr:NADH-quinone oxidoreductase subunit NuoF [Desulfobacteraceae bacterium]